MANELRMQRQLRRSYRGTCRQLAGCRIALALLATRCAPEILDGTIAGLEFLAEHSLYDRDAHRAGLDELLLVREALDGD